MRLVTVIKLVTASGASLVASHRLWILAYIIAFVSLSGCSRHGNATPPPTAKNIPIYPGGNQVIRDATGSSETRPAERVNFQTSDKGEDVITFYREVLLKDGWRIDDWSTPEPSGLRYSWNAGCPTAAIDLIIPIDSDKQTKVEVILRTFGCE